MAWSLTSDTADLTSTCTSVPRSPDDLISRLSQRPLLCIRFSRRRSSYQLVEEIHEIGRGRTLGSVQHLPRFANVAGIEDVGCRRASSIIAHDEPRDLTQDLWVPKLPRRHAENRSLRIARSGQ